MSYREIAELAVEAIKYEPETYLELLLEKDAEKSIKKERIERMGLKRKVKVKMSCTAYVTVDEDSRGNMEIEDVEEVEDIEDFEVIQTD